MVTESLWQRERTISVQALVAAIFVAGELETERQGRTRERKQEADQQRDAVQKSKFTGFYLSCAYPPLQSYPRPKD
jgi:hypothetical protein